MLPEFPCRSPVGCKLIVRLLWASVVSILLAAPAFGVINGTPVQCITDITSSGSSLTIDGADGWSTPSSGNKLLSFLGSHDISEPNIGTISCPAGFTEAQGMAAVGNFWIAGQACTKDSAGDESSASHSWGGDADDVRMVLCEFPATDLAAGGPSGSGDDETDRDSADQIAETGTATPGTTDALGVAVTMNGASSNWENSSFDQSYSLQEDFPATGNSTVGIQIATKVISDGAAQSPANTTTDTGDFNYGVILTYDGISDTITYDADNYDLGATIGWTKTGFASGDVTSLTEQAGSDSLTASGGSATACALADLVDTGNCNNTQLATSLTWRASNGTETADDTFTLDMPTGSEYSTTTSIDCTAGTDCPGDSVLVSPATTGDDAIFHFTSGSGTCNASGVCSTTTSTADVDVYVFDASAGAWLAKRTVEVTEPTGSGGSECAKVASGVIGQVIEQIKDLATCVAR